MREGKIMRSGDITSNPYEFSEEDMEKLKKEDPNADKHFLRQPNLEEEEIEMNHGEYLQHMNPYHDPRNGQFTSKNGGASSNMSQKQIDKHNKKVQKYITRIDNSGSTALNLYKEAAGVGINAALTGSRSQRRSAEKLYEYAVYYKDVVEHLANKLDKIGVKVGGQGLDELAKYHTAVGEAFIKRSLASQIGKSIITFGFGDTNAYKLDPKKILELTAPRPI